MLLSVVVSLAEADEVAVDVCELLADLVSEVVRVDVIVLVPETE